MRQGISSKKPALADLAICRHCSFHGNPIFREQLGSQKCQFALKPAAVAHRRDKGEKDQEATLSLSNTESVSSLRPTLGLQMVGRIVSTRVRPSIQLTFLGILAGSRLRFHLARAL
jgi:hypothetical protein